MKSNLIQYQRIYNRINIKSHQDIVEKYQLLKLLKPKHNWNNIRYLYYYEISRLYSTKLKIIIWTSFQKLQIEINWLWSQDCNGSRRDTSACYKNAIIIFKENNVD